MYCHLRSLEKQQNGNPSMHFERGLVKSWRSILSAGSSYNPLSHLEDAQEKGIDSSSIFS